MSVQLAKDEKILRTYDYATAKKGGLAGATVSKTLVVTNKRIIHREVGEGKNNEFLNTSEMPITSAKYVNTYYNKVGFPRFLIQAIVAAIIAVILFIVSAAFAEDLDDAAGIVTFFGVLALVFAAIFFFIYIKKKDYKFTCVIDTDTHITPAFSFASASTDSPAVAIVGKAVENNTKFSAFAHINNAAGVVEYGIIFASGSYVEANGESIIDLNNVAANPTKLRVTSTTATGRTDFMATLVQSKINGNYPKYARAYVKYSDGSVEYSNVVVSQ